MAKPIQRTIADVEKNGNRGKTKRDEFIPNPAGWRIVDVTPQDLEKNQLIFRTVTRGGHTSIKWVLKDSAGIALAQSPVGKAKQAEVIRDAISVFGPMIWADIIYIPNDDSFNAVMDEGVRQKLIVEDA